jgi:peptide/nickel transport system substrate-binding protein
MTTDQFVEGGWSDSGYHNPEYDQLYLDQQQQVDKTERQQTIWNMQEMVFNDRRSSEASKSVSIFMTPLI